MSSTEAEPKWEKSSSDAPENEIAIPLVARLGNKGQVSGTGCLIAPYLAITAKHVMKADFKDFSGREPSAKDVQEHNTITYVTPKGTTKKERYIVRRAYWQTITDIAVLWLQPVNRDGLEHAWARPRLRLTPPKAGSRIYAYGFPSSQFRMVGPGVGLIDLNPIITSGVVRDVHHLWRERGKYSFPCFHVNARFDHGLSGGPVFNEDGNVCGLVSGSLDPYFPEDEHVSYVASLWPFLAIMIDPPISPNFPRGMPYPAWELAKIGVIDVIDLDNFYFEMNLKTGKGELQPQYDLSGYPPPTAAEMQPDPKG